MNTDDNRQVEPILYATLQQPPAQQHGSRDNRWFIDHRREAL